MDELSEAELRYYNDLFKICSESESGGKIPALKATTLFRSANLTNEIINKITSLVGIPQTALHLSRQQFYGCLKLIAAFQASVPLREEILTTSVNLPMPQFSWIDSPGAAAAAASAGAGSGTGLVGPSGAADRNGYVEVKNRDLIELSAGVRERESETSTGGEMTNSDQPSTDSEVEHNDDPSMLRSAERHTVGMLKGGGMVMVSGKHTMGGSPEAWSTASDSPTPTNSVAERPWANQNLWQGLVCEEQRQLLGTEEESSDRHSSDEDQDIDLEYFYQISQTQKEYYLKQFRTIQPDVHGLVTGPVARVFFEKSRIPIEELRLIWQMCDVTRDGALNLAEFTAAMHLVVLRRNNIPVPATLPPCLMPSLLQHSLLPGGGNLPSQHSGGSAGAISTGSGSGSGTVVNETMNNSANTTAERLEPEEADLLHLESDDNTDSSRKPVDGKEYQRIVPVPDTLAFNKPIPNNTSSSSLVTVGGDSPPSVASAAPGGPKLSSSGSRKTPPNISPPILQQQQVSSSQHKSKPSSEHPVSSPSSKNNKEWNATAKEWTKFTESPTSNVSSPGPKPVNFDLQRTTQAIVSDPQILHPVPLRVTPVGAEAVDNSSLVYSDITVGTGGIIIVQSRDDSSPKQVPLQQQQQTQQPQQQQPQQQQHSNQRDSLTSASDLRAIQRPQPKKPPSKGVGAIPPPPQRETSITSNSSVADPMTTSLDAASFHNSAATVSTAGSLTLNRKLPADQPPPPLPPPRPSQHRHTRSSSLDLNKLKLSNAAAAAASGGLSKQIEDQLKMPPPPEVPPRVTPTQENQGSDGHPGFANFAHFSHNSATGNRTVSGESNVTTIHLDAAGNMTHHSTPRGSLSKSLNMQQPRNSAFEVYRKPQPSSSSSITVAGSGSSRASQSPPSQQPALVSSRSVESSSTVVVDYDKRISLLSDSLRQVRFKSTDPPIMPDILKQLKDQNFLLLRMCNDLSEELLHIQQKREDIRIKIELQEQSLGTGGGTSSGHSSLPTVPSTATSTGHHHPNL